MKPTHASDHRDAVAHDRDMTAHERERVADARDVTADTRDKQAGKRCLICDASKAIPLVVFIGVVVGLILAAGRTAWVVDSHGSEIGVHAADISTLKLEQTETRAALKYLVQAVGEIKEDVKAMRSGGN